MRVACLLFAAVITAGRHFTRPPAGAARPATVALTALLAVSPLLAVVWAKNLDQVGAALQKRLWGGSDLFRQWVSGRWGP